jgi:hypothetical protein
LNVNCGDELPLLLAEKTEIAMDAERLAALGAGPSFLLALHKLPDPNFFDRLQIFDHAHPVF